MTYDPRTPFSEPPPEALEPLHWEHERPARRSKPPYLGAMVMVCLAMGLASLVALAWLVSKW